MASFTQNSGPTLEIHPKTKNPNISYQTPSSECRASHPIGNVPDADEPEVAYSVFTEREKIMTVLMVSFIGLFSPLSANIYYPALNSLANDLHVSIIMITLTITTYMILQGLAPSFIGNFSDIKGRRPAYLICFALYLAANIGLALQNNYAALMVLRCLQSAGSSGTVVLGAAVVADMTTRADRGKYIGYASLGVALGPTVGPILGGALDTCLGWKSIFWFLVIFSGIMFVAMLVLLPETCRTIVGNGSIPPPKWNTSLLSYLQQRRQLRKDLTVDQETVAQPVKRRLNPLATLSVVRDKGVGLILCYAAINYAGYIAVLSTLSSQLAARYHLDSLKVGLCFIPVGAGSLTSRWVMARLLDRNYRRQATKAGIEVIANRQQKLDNFPIEKARLQVVLPVVFASCCMMIAYAWIMEHHTPLAVVLVILFFCGCLFSGVMTSLSVLVVDQNKESPATAVAAMNLFRCLLGAGSAAVATPCINAIGIGWTGTLVAGIWVLCCPMLWIVMEKGHGWREEKRKKMDGLEKAESKKEIC